MVGTNVRPQQSAIGLVDWLYPLEKQKSRPRAWRCLPFDTLHNMAHTGIEPVFPA